MKMRTYTTLSQLPTLEERFAYLELGGEVGASTFGFDRWINQKFYHSTEWRNIRRFIIVRDNGMDLGVADTPIHGRPYIHHMNPIVLADIQHSTDNLLEPEYLISVSHRTHNAIHYGDKSQLPRPFVARHPGDTRLW